VTSYRIALLVLIHTSLSRAQTAATQPEFEVASIKLNANCGGGFGGRGGRPFSTGRVNMECVTVQNLIQLAYGSFADGVSFNQAMLQISGGPGWIESERYNLAAKAEGAAHVEQMMGPMLRALLEDRLKLKVHRVTREMPVYSLTVAKNGLKARPLKEGSCVPIDINHLPEPPAQGQTMPNFCGNTSMRTNGRNAVVDVHGTSMKDFAQRLTSMGGLDRKVIDKTGIEGLFDIHLEFTRDQASGAGDAGNPAPPAEIAGASILDALQEQLGLKLLPDKGPVESLVIDHVEKPSEN
jgi:uncharacterized protein (TIGR03435 family)